MKKPFIICVDDEQMVLNTLNKQLKRRFGRLYEYEFAESAEEAFDIIEELIEEENEIAMILSDQIMPGTTGVELLSSIHQKLPSPIKVLLTGQAALEAAITGINEAGLYRYLNKPWDEADLLLTVEKGLEEYKLNRTLRKQVEIFRRFVPQQFLHCLGIDNFESIESIEPLEVVDIEMSVLFLDVRRFSRMSEVMTGVETFNFLNNFYKQMEPPIAKHGGFIDKFMGDSIMALFHDTTADAVDAGIAIFKELEVYNKNKSPGIDFQVDVRIGINTGACALGIMGSNQRSDSTVVGDTVNIASRIEELNKHFGTHFLISEVTYDNLSDPNKYFMRFIGTSRIRGKSQPVKLYEIFEMDSAESRKLKCEDRETFENAVQLLQKGQEKEAQPLLEECVVHNPHDTVAQVYLEQCSH